MRNEDARFILQAYRAGGHDALDPAFAEALAQARGDPVLAKWLEQELAHTAEVGAKLRAVPPPPGLRNVIMMGEALARRQARVRRLRPVWVGLAAGLALGVVSALFWPHTAQADVAELAAFAIKDSAQAPHPPPSGSAAVDLVNLLQNPSTCLTTGLHFDFETLRTTGCRTLNDSGHEILEVCFLRNGNYFHLYVAKREDFAHFHPPASLGPVERDGVGFASWADQSYYYMVVSRAGASAISSLL